MKTAAHTIFAVSVGVCIFHAIEGQSLQAAGWGACAAAWFVTCLAHIGSAKP